MAGVIITVGLVVPAIFCHSYDADMPDLTDKGKDIRWYCPIFDDDGYVIGHSVCRTPTSLTEEDYLVAWHDESMVRAGLDSYGYTIPDCPNKVIENLDASVCASGGDMYGYTDRERCITIQSFVMNGILYCDDEVLYGCNDYASTPAETLYLGRGDCEDASILFVSIARAYDMDATLILFDGHCMAGIRMDGYKGSYDGYVPIECTHYRDELWCPITHVDGDFIRVLSDSPGDSVARAVMRYCNRTMDYNPILYIAGMLS